MSKLTRRNFIRLTGTIGAATSVLGWPMVSLAGKASGRVVIIGGGFRRGQLRQVSQQAGAWN